MDWGQSLVGEMFIHCKPANEEIENLFGQIQGFSNIGFPFRKSWTLSKEVVRLIENDQCQRINPVDLETEMAFFVPFHH